MIFSAVSFQFPNRYKVLRRNEVSDKSAGKRISPSTTCAVEGGPGHTPRREIPSSFDMVDKTGRE